jgi:long-subunit fatty acid transport protein
MRNICGLVVLVVTLLLVGKASASTDINGLFDARSHGMGGTGVAYVDSAGAIAINPALLDQVDRLSISANVMFITAQPTAPYTIWHKNAQGQYYTNYETIRSKPTWAPLPFLGLAYRLPMLGDRVTIGLGAYPLVGQGAKATYRPAPDEYPGLVATNNVAMGLIEVGDAISVRILRNLSVAVMWRLTIMTQTVDTPVPTYREPAGVFVNADHTEVAAAKINTRGMNFTGFQFGMFYRPTPSLRLGFSYRSKVVAEGNGYTVTHFGTQEIKLKTKTTFPNPHALRAGFAWSTFSDKLLLAADFKYLFYAESWKTANTWTTMNGKTSVDKKPTHFYDSWVVQLGAELKTGSVVALRAGYTVLRSATNPDYALAYFAPPGYSHLVTVGLGFKVLDNFNLDAAAAFVMLESHVNKAAFETNAAGRQVPTNAGVGLYGSRGSEFSLTASYHR